MEKILLNLCAANSMNQTIKHCPYIHHSSSSNKHPHPYQPVPPIVLPPVVIRPVVAIASSTVSRSTQTCPQKPQSAVLRDASIQTECSTALRRTFVGTVEPSDYVGWSVYATSGWDHSAPSANGMRAPCECSGSINLTTQTEVSDLASHFLSLGTQTELVNDPANQLLSLGTQTEFINDPANHLLSLGTQTAEAPTSSQSCQTQEASSCEFGTQTYSDFAAQYLAHNPSSVVDFGTQTAASEQAYSLGTRQEDLHQGLCLDDQAFCNSFLLPPECMDFGTQTLDELPCLHDLGVQTLLPAETKDQGSQTPVTVLQYKTSTT